MACGCCLYTSFAFILNAILSIYFEYYTYSGLFLILFLTSIYYHTTYTLLSNVLDKSAILAVILYGLYLVNKKEIKNNHTKIKSKKLVNLVVNFIILSICFLWVFKTFNKKYLFIQNDQMFHCTLHIISSICFMIPLFM